MSEAPPPTPPAENADPSQAQQTPPPPKRGRKRRAAWRWSRRTSALAVALFAALFVSFFTLDLGRVTILGESLLTVAEREGSKYLERPLHIGSIAAEMSPGVFVLTDVVIDGLEPGDRPFFRADLIRVHVPWWTMFRNRIEVEVELFDWEMVVERWEDGRHNMPRFTPKPRDEPRGPSPWTTTVRFAHANDGTFTFEDHGAPWSVVAPNLDFSLVRSEIYQTYLGRAQFSGGTVAIQDFVPMWANMTTRFSLDGSRVSLHHIDLETDGAHSHVTGSLDFTNWPVQTYHVNSTVDFPRMRELFFANETWALGGTGEFRGMFQIFRDGRDLSGVFSADEASVNGLEFERLHGTLEWLPEHFRVLHAESDFYGGRTSFTYGLEGMGLPTRPTANFATSYTGVDVRALLTTAGLESLDPVGTADGTLELSWPNGRFSDGKQGQGRTVITSTAALAPATLPASVRVPEPEQRPEGVTFDGHRPLGPLPVGGELVYHFEPDQLVFDDSWAATPSTYVSFDGATAYGDESTIPFHVTSLDWQESDRLLAAIMTAFGSSTGAVEVGGYGVFDGTMTESFRAPQITGRFESQAMRAWDVTWGAARGDIVIHDRHLDIIDGLIGDAEGPHITADGRFSLGYPRDDGGEEINGRIVVNGWPLADIRHAFKQDEWPIDGTIGLADLQLRGRYEGPDGTGTLRLENGTAWGESFGEATGALTFEGDGVFVSRIQMAKAGGIVNGSARIGWDGTYSFEADGARLAVEQLDNFSLGDRAPLTGQLRFKANGTGQFDHPSYEFQGSVADLFIGDEGIGQVTGRLSVEGDVLTIADLNVTEPRVQLSGSGTIGLDERRDARLSFRFLNTSVDPYLKFIGEGVEVSEFTGIIASGRIEVAGPLVDRAALAGSLTVDEALITPLDYEFSTVGPARFVLENNVVKLEQARLGGLGTELDLGGAIDLGREVIDVTANGDANLAILQVFFGSLSATGAARVSAELTGPLAEPAVTGLASITNGSIRHFDLPHSLAAINGPIRIRESRIDVSDLTARMGGGDVTFDGAINLRSYRPEEFNVRASGRSMRLRYPEGFTSFVNADLDLQGPVESPHLSGAVDVLSVDYRPQVEPGTGILGLAGGAVASVPEASVTEASYPLTFDVDIQVARMSLIRNQSATVEGSATLRFTGTIDEPSLTGRVSIDGGTAFILGNRYTVRQGSIDFADFPRLDTVFDVEAVTRPRAAGQTYDVTVRITGSLAELTPTVTSDPWLPELDVVTLLLGGSPDLGGAEQRGIESAEETQTRMMQTAAAVLLASPVSDRLSSVVQEVLPLETVQVTPVLGNELSTQRLDPGARIILGKQISSRVYLTYSRVLNSTQDEIILLEYDQNDRVSWVLSRNENQTFALDIYIRYRF